MSEAQDVAKAVVAFSLVFLGVVLAGYLWFVDLLTMQGSFGAILGAELVVFAMLIHVYMKPSFVDMSKIWMLTGCAFLVVLLLIAL